MSLETILGILTLVSLFVFFVYKEIKQHYEDATTVETMKHNKQQEIYHPRKKEIPHGKTKN